MNTKIRHIIGATVSGLFLAVLLLLLHPAVDARPLDEPPPPRRPGAITADGAITGVVTGDDTAAPIAGVQICAYREAPHVYRCASTDAGGVYSISVPAGNYQVIFLPPDYHMNEYYDNVPYNSPNSHTPVAVADDTVTPNINAGLAVGMQIGGQVTDEITGNPLLGVTAYVEDPGGYYYAYGSTGADGVYTATPGLPAGSYRVQFADYGGMCATEYYSNVYLPGQATLVTLTTANLTGIDAVLTQAAVITGLVTDGGPLSNIQIDAYFADEDAYANGASTDANGVYRLTGLAPIAYKLRFYDSTGQYLVEWHQDKPNWDAADPISLTGGVTTTVNAQLTTGAVLTGTVTAEGSGVPLTHIRVSAYDAITGDSIAGDYTDVLGVYRIGGLVGGVYKLRFQDYAGVYLDEYYDDKPDLASADTIVLTVGVTTTVDAVLTPGAVISGTVTDAGHGTGLDAINIIAYDATTNNYAGQGATDAAGIYRIGGLASGGYKLYFYDNGGIYIAEYYDDKPNLAGADPVMVTAGVTTTVNAALTPGAVISGTVTDENHGAGLNSVTVVAYDAATDYYVREDTTTAAGIYRIGGLAAGSYKLYFYDPSGVYLNEYYDDKPDLASADPIALTTGVTTTVNAVLTPGAVISGTVTDESHGAGLNSVTVTAYDAATGNYIRDDATDAAGVYRIGGLADGSYKLYFYDPSGVYIAEYYDDKPDLASADPIVLTAGVTATVNAALAPGAVISGTVTDESHGAGLHSVTVTAYDAATGDYIRDDATDAAGVYCISGLAPGSYKLYFYDYNGVYVSEYYDDKPNFDIADPIAATPGMTVTANAALAQGGILSGTVTEAGSGLPLDNIDVNVYDAATDAYVKDANTDADGIYRISGLAAGGYKLYFRDPNSAYMGEYYDDKSSLATADPIAVTAGLTTTANAALTAGGVLSGAVTEEGSGAPLAGIQVRAYDAATNTSIASVATDAAGVYRLGGLANGAYKLRFRDSSGVYLTEYYDNQSSLSHADLVMVTGGMTTTANAALTRAGTLSGTITEEGSGAPLEAIAVNVYEAATGNYVAAADTDANGVYRLGGLADGLYKLYFYDNGGNYLSEYYADKPSLSDADLVTVTAGLTSTVDAALAHGGRITGRVTDAASGVGIAGVSVSVARQDASSPDGSASTDAGGYYTTTALYTGVYRVRFSPPQPYHSEDYDGFRWWETFTPVTVSAPLTTTGVDATLHTGPLITGFVAGPAPLEDVYVKAYRGADSYASANAYTRNDGTYRLGPLDPDAYRIYFEPDGIHAGEWYSDSESYRGAGVVTLLSDDVTDVNADLSNGGVISGTVSGTGGAPLADVWVYVYPVGSDSSVASDRTDAAGYYATRPGLPTGEYQIKFSAPPGYTTEWYNDRGNRSTATPLTVTSGVTVTADAQLAPYAWGAITGAVTAADTGLPVNVWVYAYNASGANVRSVYASGAYVLDYLPPAVYRVYFGSPPAPYVSRYYSDKSGLSAADLITVTAGVTVTNINQALPRGGAIHGVVTDTATGAGIPGVHVYARRVVGSWTSKETYTGVDGTYRLEGLPDGGYKVQFTSPPPFVCEWYDDVLLENAAAIVTVTLGATVNAHAALGTGGVVTGVVTAADTGAPLAGAYVYVYSSTTGAFITGVYVGRDGAYRTPGLPAGDYWIYFSVGPWAMYWPEWYMDAHTTGDRISVTVPSAGAIPNIDAALERGGSISGWTYSQATGRPLNDVYVAAHYVAAQGYVDYDYSNDWGFYQIDGLPNDLYKVYFSRNGYVAQWYDQAADFTAALTVTVNASSEVSNVNAYLRSPHGVYLPLVLRNGE
ncbi:MAG TPA: carboxypeptidase regulatory-like domain-containing protein [Anaerolineae bacterium]|nr:carboxypeptidase regulatory-like domain-containing protein [Anaerolineae bacterium]